MYGIVEILTLNLSYLQKYLLINGKHLFIQSGKLKINLFQVFLAWWTCFVLFCLLLLLFPNKLCIACASFGANYITYYLTCRSVKWKIVTSVSFLKWEKDKIFLCGKLSHFACYPIGRTTVPQVLSCLLQSLSCTY